MGAFTIFYTLKKQVMNKIGNPVGGFELQDIPDERVKEKVEELRADKEIKKTSIKATKQ